MLSYIKTLELPFQSLGMKVGTDHTRCPSPDHEGKTSCSCHIKDEAILWKCHNCGKGGTIVDAYMAAYGMDESGAIKMLTSTYGDGQSSYQPPPLKKDKYEAPKKISPTDLTINSRPKFKKYGKVVRHKDHTYRCKIEDATSFHTAPCLVDDQFMAAAVARWDMTDPDGQPIKIIRQYHYDGQDWHEKGIPTKTRPIYKMSEIANSDEDTQIFIVEGEKCMDALQDACDKLYQRYEAFPRCIVTTSIGGSKSAKRGAWGVIGGRPTTVLRDNDKPGETFAQTIKEKIPACKIINVASPQDPDGYDVADYLDDGGDPRSIMEMEPESIAPEDAGILERAMDIALTINPMEISQFLKDVSKHNPDEIFIDLLLQRIKDTTGVNIGALRRQMKQHKQEQQSDWYEEVANHVIKTRFEGNLILKNKIFWGYNGRYWQKYPNDVIKKYVLQSAQVVVPGDVYDSELFVRKSYPILKAKAATYEDVLGMGEAPKPIINTINCELHIDPMTGKIEKKPHNPRSFLTHCLDIEYDPKATCPEYDEAIKDIACGDEEWIRHWHEVGGYIIQPHRRFKNFFLGFGRDGNNGKTSLFRLVTALVGKSNVCFKKIDEFGQSKHDTSALVGKIMLLDDDMNKDTRLSDGFIKQLSEQKDITVEYKGKDHFDMQSYAALVMLSNHYPYTTDLTDAMLSRAMLIPFNAHFPKDDPDTDVHLFDRIIASELSGVLNHFLKGISRLFGRGCWKAPKACQELREDWLKETNNLYAFFREALKPDGEGAVYSRELREAYEAWCRNEHIEKRYMLQNRRMKSAFKDLGLDISHKTNNNWGKWKINGYTLRPQTD